MKQRGWVTIICLIALMIIIFFGLNNLSQNKSKNERFLSDKTWQWERYRNNPVLEPENIPKDSHALYFAMADPTVLFDQGIFKMWFGYGGLEKADDLNSVRVKTAYATSTDGFTWKIVRAPALEPTGKDGDWDKTNAETPSVVIDDSLPEGNPRRYRLYYSGLDHFLLKLPLEKIVAKGMMYGIGLAFSADGKYFTRLPASESPYGIEGLTVKPNPVVDGDTWDLINIADPHVLKKMGKYYLWYTSQGRIANPDTTYTSIAFATSDDGIHWQKHGPVLSADQEWEKGNQKEYSVGRPYVLWNGKEYEMFYDGELKDDNPDHNTVSGVGYATSVDGEHWIKQKKPIFVTDRGKVEKKGIIVGVAVLKKDDTYYMYYTGAPQWQRLQINVATYTKK